MSLDTVKTVHLAAPHVFVGDRCIQRCMICGHKLVDMTPDDKGNYIIFPANSMLEVEQLDETLVSTTLRGQAYAGQTGKLPPNCCCHSLLE